ncbi:galactosyltransferase-related protein [Hydromonas duriensis]|uniref:Galactosyltransferase-like protein n=1 Tax=Hydromonas duriensis TaxID=1527608 RepID=A0A4R6Y3R8_9BURK|nr:galactosyltransferase-related protein [Hydromonas duriensis]TDR31010.1 galactosyltransferase-like protein [Hydromonas duriensis]
MNTTSLHNIDVIMSFRGNTAEREENLYAVLRHFSQTYTDYTIWLMESDTAPKFNWHRVADPRVQHVFTYSAGPFPKAFLYNLGAKLSRCEALLFLDVDCIPNPSVLSSCVYNIMFTKNNDVLVPYFGAINIAGETKQRFVDNPSYDVFTGIDKNHLNEDSVLLYESSMGGAFIFRREAYIRVGGMDTTFIGWGGEDNEFFYRSKRLGIPWSSMDVPLFHLHHDSTHREDFNAKAIANSQRAYQSNIMPMDELQHIVERLKPFFN